MNTTLIERKIEQIDFWLQANPNHPDYAIVLKDKQTLIKQLTYQYSK